MSEVLVGRYRLDNVIGSGGMGSVWRGYDQMLHRPVAVKELHLPPQLGDAARAEAVARAVAEARNAARLQHPGIVAVYDIVEHDGRPWIVMQLVEGVSLFQHVRQHGPVSPAEAARIGVALLEALAVAHAAGVVHRDVKPSNVLLGPRGEVLLTDFSIAYAVGAVTMTNTGVVLGSPGYVAPERVSRGRTGPETDLFGVGATLFFLVEGYGPFDNDDPLAGLLASATQPHPRPRNAGPLTPVIDGLLIKDPAQRMTAAAAADALAAIVGRGVGAPAPWPAAQPAPWRATQPAPWPAAQPGPAFGAAPAPTGALRGFPGGAPSPYAGRPAPPPPPFPPRPDVPPRPGFPDRPDRSGESTWLRRHAPALVAAVVVLFLLAGGGFLASRLTPDTDDGDQELGAPIRSAGSSVSASPTASATPTPEPSESPTPSPSPSTSLGLSVTGDQGRL